MYELKEVHEVFLERERISCTQLVQLFGPEVSKHLAELVYMDLIQVDIYTGIWKLK